ncbi:TIGR04255 family protein [Methylotenera versatilis]|uniref:TIGR04255 family protein n=1 Tax=Methylotenera versatilis (strain 301) TaxID=666681 RepID=D7DKE2_METV0|nr:TIGR04255 family protein [Methylotenera versatilis]ADI28527.1 hypothetical protein M301_0139 [Methylotenera versatilis 301]
MELNGCHVIAARSTHAVQAASFVLELPAHISSDIAQAALNYYENSHSLKELFPIKTEAQGISINLDDQSVNVNQSTGLQGLTLQRVTDDGSLELSFAIQNNQMVYTCHKYTGWKEVFEKALSILSEFMEFVCPVPGVSVVGIQYVDEFFITGNKEGFRSDIIFSTDNTRLPVSLLSASGFWHNHSGWFSPTPDKTQGQVLNNLNVSVYPQQPDRHAVQIITAHRLMLALPISDKGRVLETLPTTFEMLHSTNKALFREVLNEETLRSINLLPK